MSKKLSLLLALALLAAVVAATSVAWHSTSEASFLASDAQAAFWRTEGDDHAAQMPLPAEEIGADAIWDPLLDEDRLQRIHGCVEPGRTDCAVGAMEESGASPEAIDFFESTGWFLVDFQETGTVDLGSLLDPWRANTNEDYALLNGNPVVVVVEAALPNFLEALPLIETDPHYDDLVAFYPNLSPFTPDSVFEAHASSPEGGQRFIFQIILIDGCHACGSGYMTRVALDVAPDGTYLVPTSLGICWRGHHPRTVLPRGFGSVSPVTTDVPDCPGALTPAAVPFTGGRPSQGDTAWSILAVALGLSLVALGVAVGRRAATGRRAR